MNTIPKYLAAAILVTTRKAAIKKAAVVKYERFPVIFPIRRRKE